jgi:hypothetical protein
MFFHKVDGATPPNNTVERYQISEYPDATPGPNMIGAEFWVDSPDPLSTGAWALSINYTGPNGVDVELSASPMGFNDGTQIGRIPVEMCERIDASGMFEIRVNSFGDPGTATIAYRVLMTPSASCDLQPFTVALVP